MASNLQYLYNVEWQIMRVNMLGTWFKYDSALINYAKLLRYSCEAGITAQEKKRRLWRIVNYLNAVRMGYSGSNKYGSDVDELLVFHRGLFQERWHLLDDVSLGEWDWSIVIEDLHKLHKEDRKTFLAIMENLNKRKTFAKKKVGTLKFRPELQMFIGIMGEIDNG